MSKRHCWLRLRPHKNTGRHRVNDTGHVYTVCAECEREYLWRCPLGCIHDRPA